MNSITFMEFDGKGRVVYDTDSLDDKPSGTELTFAKGEDDQTKQPKRYSVRLQPGAKTGSWKYRDLEGELENVERKDMGVEHTVTGTWVEDGLRKRFEVFFWK